MPSFTGKTFANFYKNILGINQASNTGVDATTRNVHDGDGNSTAISLSDDQLVIQPINDNTTTSLTINNQGGEGVLYVDTVNKTVRCGASSVPATTLIKEMGLYDFSPTAGYHYPLIANTMFVPTGATAFAADNDWGNGADPAATLDVSGLTAQENAIAVYWYVPAACVLDTVRVLATADGSATLNFHLESYTLDTSSNIGDLSAGTTHASGSIAATASTIKTTTLTLDSASISRDKIVIGFVENETDTSDLSCSMSIMYHLE